MKYIITAIICFYIGWKVGGFKFKKCEHDLVVTDVNSFTRGNCLRVYTRDYRCIKCNKELREEKYIEQPWRYKAKELDYINKNFDK